MSNTRSWQRLDGPFSWLVCVSSFLCNVVLAGVCFTPGIYYVMFLEAFNEGKGFTGLTTSVYFGSQAAAGEYSADISFLH